MKIAEIKPDAVGAFASLLCIIHCIATPVIFVAHACSIHESDVTPLWWSGIDILFLGIAFFAIKHAVKHQTKKRINLALWINWSLLALAVLNDKFVFFELPHYITYILAISLAILHLYNLKYCNCKSDQCCMPVK